jgi:hypothetical protein
MGGFSCNGEAPQCDLELLAAPFNGNVPTDYAEFLLRCDGGEGFIGNEYVILWRANEIEQFNREYEVSSYLADVVLFGSNGGGEAFGFRKTDSQWEVIQVPFVGMAPDVVQFKAESFSQFIRDSSKT